MASATIRLGNNTDSRRIQPHTRATRRRSWTRGDVWFVGGGKDPVAGNYDYPT